MARVNMKDQDKFYKQRDLSNLSKVSELCMQMPSFCKEFLLSGEIEAGTRLGYARDILAYFSFLEETNPLVAKAGIEHITLDLLNELRGSDFDEYARYLNSVGYNINTRSRKLCAIKSFFGYLYRMDRIGQNETDKIALPSRKKREENHEIVFLEGDEVSLLLDRIRTGTAFTGKKQQRKDKTRLRDLAIISLLLYTGIRVSECAGIDFDDLNLDHCCVTVHRKGGHNDTVYFSDVCRDALVDYLEERKHILAEDGSEKAIFLSDRRKRLSVRMIETLVEEYCEAVGIVKHITPHKLRSTYGTNFYRETGDIYLTATNLGHSDVATTRRHYASMKDEHKRESRNVLKY